MNVKSELFSEESDSDTLVEMSRPTKTRKIKEDPDWGDEGSTVKRKAAAKPKIKSEGVKCEPIGGIESKRTRKVKGECERDSKAKARAKSTTSKVRTAPVKRPKDEDSKEFDCKRKFEDDDGAASKKLKKENVKCEEESSAEGSGARQAKEAVIVAHNMNCSVSKASTLMNLLNDGATIPFLIRYRKGVVGDWSPTEMRLFKELCHGAKEIVTRAAFIKKKIAAKNHLNEKLEKAIDDAWTMAELDDIYEPYKPAKVPSKLSIVRDLGLDVVADQILNKQYVDLNALVNSRNEHVKSLEDVKTLLATAIAETILRKMKDVSRLWREDNWMVQCAKLAKGKVEDEKENFRKYYDFRRPAKSVRADEVLAMSRGAKKKILKVSFVPRNSVEEEIQRAINDVFRLNWLPRDDVGDVLNRSVTMAKDKLMTKIPKKIKVDHSKAAEITAIEVFNANLKRLLLTPPFRADHEFHVLGIDPGKRNGCKTVIVNSKSLAVKDNAILHLFPFKSGSGHPYEFERRLKDIIKKWGIEIVVIGNGVGCQEVETVVNNIVRLPEFSSVRYTIVPEQGVSVYSVSEEAQEEYPDFSPEVVSSLSLVKRFFNPLHEYVKVDPKHLGIGMYQHDIDVKKLTEALQETVSEIVSVVGVDLNAASVPLLKSIAGLTESRAKAIVTFRNENGSFKNRKELLGIKGIGPKTYQQCAGFVRIIPPSNALGNYYNPLDQTIVHPEHYGATHKLIDLIGLSMDDIGSEDFISQVKTFTSRENPTQVSERIGVDVATTKLLLHALAMSLNQDIRTLAEPPDFKTRLCTMDQLRTGMTVTGRVENVTTFGAFVDIGVEVSGLLYFSPYSRPDVGLGDRIEVIVDAVEVNRNRIGLAFKRKIADLFPMNKLI